MRTVLLLIVAIVTGLYAFGIAPSESEPARIAAAICLFSTALFLLSLVLNITDALKNAKER
ncbi:MAG TPA: hypothetical protein VEB18_04140 [Candidatus Paceibacterota bacterium]|nr:hypothetical protein [Candidatus Paceibacterota bacterium]